MNDRPEMVLSADKDNLHRLPTASVDTASMLGAEQPVLDAHALMDLLGLGNAVGILRIKLAFPSEVFALAAQPLIDGFAELVQMLPVRGSVRFGQPGGHLQMGLTTALRALERRRGQILPRGAAPEVIGELSHRWTYAVFVAALLRDVGRVSEGCQVRIKSGVGLDCLWIPGMGSMRDCGAQTCFIELNPTGMSSEPIDLGLSRRLFERYVPQHILDWLKEDPALVRELHAYLQGVREQGGVIAALVAIEPSMHPKARALTAEPVPAPVQVPTSSVVKSDGRISQYEQAVDTPEFLEGVNPAESGRALEFMAWLKQGLHDGALAVNSPNAFVHVVADGLLLSAPRAFREFADTQVASTEPAVDVAKRVQREVLRQGWHIRAERGVNFLCYERKRSGGGTSPIDGIVIREPQRFFRSLPAIDFELVRLADPARKSA